MQSRVGIVVDGYSTGAQVASHLKASGVDLIHIDSSDTVPPEIARSFRGELYSKSLKFNGNLDVLCRQLATFAPAFVTPGTESGVELAEAIAGRLGLPGNDPRTIGQRSNKARMGEALARAGVPCAGQRVVTDLASLHQSDIDALGYPVVVKPTESAGSDDVLVALSFDEVERHVGHVLGRANKLGKVNQEVLIQAFIRGQQYIVNSVSLAGEHCICEIWKDHRQQTADGHVLYDHEYLVALDEPESRILVEYTKRCLDAMGVKYGPVHAEIIFTDAGPRLIEIGARCQGGILGGVVQQAIGNSHASLTALLLSDPETFREHVRELAYSPRVMVVTLNSHVAGTVDSVTYQESLGSLASFAAVMSMPSPGDRVEKTKDLFTGLGVIYLVHDELEVLSADLAAIRSMERTNAFLRIREAA